MGTLTLTDFTGALEGVADVDYRLVAAGARVTSPWNESAVDTNTLLKYKMNEAAWNTTPGEVIDASGNGYHGTASGGATTAAGALDRYGNMGVSSKNDHVLTPTIPWPATFTLEFWAYHTKPNVNDFLLGGSDTTARQCQLRGNISADPTSWEWRAFSAAKYFTVSNDAWHHWTLQATRAGGVAQAWIDGVNVMDSTAGNGAAGNITFGFGKAAGYSAGADSWFDDVRLSNSLRRGDAGNFTPPTWFSSSSLRMAASTVDSALDGGGPGAQWQTLQFTMAAPTGDETAAVWFAASDSASVPSASSGLWQLLGSGYTTGQLLDVSAFYGQYGHTKVVAGASTGIGQYAVELDGLEYTFAPASTGRPWLSKVLPSGRYA